MYLYEKVSINPLVQASYKNNSSCLRKLALVFILSTVLEVTLRKNYKEALP